MCSSASLRRPTYSVLQSVRKGLPPRAFTLSATALAKFGRRKERFPGSPKCSLIATNLFSKSISPMPAAIHQLVQLFQQAGAYLAAHVGKIHFRNAHGRNLLAWRRACPRIVSGRPVPETPGQSQSLVRLFQIFYGKTGWDARTRQSALRREMVRGGRTCCSAPAWKAMPAAATTSII